MCYTSLNVEQSSLEARYEAKVVDGKVLELIIHANAYSAPALPIIKAQQPEVIALAHWRLIPCWAKTGTDAGKLRTMTINARLETVFDKPSFRGQRSQGGGA